MPAVPAQAATAPATPPPDTLAATEAWRTAVGAWFASRTVYPDEARRRGEEGRAIIRFTVGRDGRVLLAELVRGTGSTLLDDAITTLLTQLRASRLPALPAALPQDEVSVTRAINFSLTR